jgi:hypothetical protein
VGSGGLIFEIAIIFDFLPLMGFSLTLLAPHREDRKDVREPG